MINISKKNINFKASNLSLSKSIFDFDDKNKLSKKLTIKYIY